MTRDLPDPGFFVMAHPMTPKERFLRACRRQEVDRPPVWMMRQAGRYLPEYRAIKLKHPTKEMMQTPEIASEITLQPVRLLGVDAAILYSDILMIPDALGQGLSFAAGEGPRFEFGIRSSADLNRLQVHDVLARLSYVFAAATLCVRKLPADYPLLGFAGAPFTVACYMIAGGAESGFASVFDLIENDPAVFHSLMRLLSGLTLEYLQEQANAGVAAIQLFDTWAGLLTPAQYETWAKPYTETILQGLKTAQIPSIHFIKNGPSLLDSMATLPSDVIGVDWTIPLADAFAKVKSNYALQGNFDPQFLKTDPVTIENELQKMLRQVPDLRQGYILNLGHGIDKDTPVANAQHFVKRAQELGCGF